LTPASLVASQSAASAVEVNEVVHAMKDEVLVVRPRVSVSADHVSFYATDAFPDDQRIFEPGIDYERWTTGIERDDREAFADTLDFVEYLDD
jgi:hypothetical protein